MSKSWKWLLLSIPLFLVVAVIGATRAQSPVPAASQAGAQAAPQGAQAPPTGAPPNTPGGGPEGRGGRGGRGRGPFTPPPGASAPAVVGPGNGPKVPAGMGSRSPSPRQVLVIGANKSFPHDSITAAAVAVYEMGKESTLWDTTIRTDTELVVRKKAPNMMGFQPQGLNDFDAIVLDNTSGEFLTDQQMKDLLDAVHDDGIGVVGFHSALDSSYNGAYSAGYHEMLGGYFAGHPFNTFPHPIVNFPLINEEPSFPAMSHLPHEIWKQDELYMPRNWSRDNVNVLLRLDQSKMDFTGITTPPNSDAAIAWVKMYGKGRVFYSSLGHTKEAYSDPDVRRMYEEAIKWVLGLTEGTTQSHPMPKE